MSTQSLAMLKTVAHGLGGKRADVAFVGGAAVFLYASDAAAADSRPTLDVDCIVEIASYADYAKLEDDLHRLGFENDVRVGAPMCRFLYQGIIVDVMSTPYDIGFNNMWFKEGLRHTAEQTLAPGLKINILEFPYFVGTKLAALNDRGKIDLRTSKDFEDIIFLLRNRRSALAEISGAVESIRTYIVAEVSMLLKADNIDEAISCALDHGEPPGTAARIKNSMEQSSALWGGTPRCLASLCHSQRSRMVASPSQRAATGNEDARAGCVLHPFSAVASLCVRA